MRRCWLRAGPDAPSSRGDCGADHGAGAVRCLRSDCKRCARGRDALLASVYAILAYFLYSNLLAAVRVWIEKERPPDNSGLWWVHLLPLLLAAWLCGAKSIPAVGAARAAAAGA